MNIPPPDANFAAALAWLVGAAGGLSAVAVIVRWALRAGRAIDALHVIIEREMTPNGGGSMKDKLDEQCASGRRRDALLQHHIESDDAVQGVMLTELARIREKLDDVWYRVTGMR